MSLTLYLGMSLLLGIRHALDPDHLVAVSTLVAGESRLWPAARLGLLWGAGHLAPLALLGLPVVWLGLQLPPAMENAVDLMVGLLLVGLGIVTFHIHTHKRDHRHAHGDRPGRSGIVTVLVGMVHGLAGTGPAVVLAVAASASVGGSIGYLLLFGLGTCLGMFLVTLCVAAPALAVARKLGTLQRTLQLAAGTASLLVGLSMFWERVALLMA